MRNLREVLAWFWPATTSRSDEPVLSRQCCVLIGRSRVANELAERAFRPADALPYAGGDAVACELSREAIYWALRAHREASTVSLASSTAIDANAEPFTSLWDGAPSELLVIAAGGSQAAEQLRPKLIGKAFSDFAELSSAEQVELAPRLHAFAKALVAPLVAPQRQLERAWLRRMLLLATAGLLVLGVWWAASALSERRELSLDMAPKASWKASSDYYGLDRTCASPSQTCPAGSDFFFHTLEEKNPSIVFDLGETRQLSGVLVENRRDCCKERALPLLVQVSTDNRHWKTVATRSAPFMTWREHFPSVQARWVKLYVPRVSLLHLARVRLLP